MFSGDKSRYPLLLHNILRVRKATEDSLLFLPPAGLVAPRPEQEQGAERAGDDPNAGFQSPTIIWTRSKSSPSDASSSGRAASAIFFAVSRFSESVVCYPDLAMQRGLTPAQKEMPRFFPEKKGGDPQHNDSQSLRFELGLRTSFQNLGKTIPPPWVCPFLRAHSEQQSASLWATVFLISLIMFEIAFFFFLFTDMEEKA